MQGAKAISSLLAAATPSHMQTKLNNTVLKSCANAGDVRSAMEWLSEMRMARIRVNQKTYGKMTEAAAKAGNTKMADAWCAAGSQQFGTNEHFFAMMIDACAKSGQVARAAAALSQMAAARFAPSTAEYNGVLQACARAGRPQEAAQWLLRMVSASAAPNVASYGSIIDAYAKMGLPEEAATWLRRMASSALVPNVIAFSSVVNAFARAGAFADALKCVDAMRAAAVVPNVVTYGGILSECARAGRPEEASRILLVMNVARVEPNAVAYTAAVTACARARDAKGAVDLLRKMGVAQVAPNVLTFTSAILACARVMPPQLLLVERLVRDMRTISLTPDEKLLEILSRTLGKSRVYALRTELGFAVAESWAKREARLERISELSRGREIVP